VAGAHIVAMGMYRSTNPPVHSQQRSQDGVPEGIIRPANLLQRSLEQIPDGDPLADMQVSKGIEVNSARLVDIFVRALCELCPGVLPGKRRKLFSSPAAVHDPRFIFW
jgi:hypothetical protein